MNKVKTIVAKEWAEVFRNRMVLLTVAFLPMVLTALPLIMLAVLNQIDDVSTSMTEAAPAEFFGQRCAELSEVGCAQVYMLDLFTMMFMIMPVAIPVTIAAYSIVGEKSTRSLEPLLATPITTAELMTGKALAAAIPAILVTWLGFIIFLIGTYLQVEPAVFAQATNGTWALAIFVVGPLLTVLSVLFAMLVSARVSDPRVAEQMATVVILPIILLIVGQSVGLILINRQTILFMGLIVLLIDVVLLFVSVKMFQREAILTRWK